MQKTIHAIQVNPHSERKNSRDRKKILDFLGLILIVPSVSIPYLLLVFGLVQSKPVTKTTKTTSEATSEATDPKAWRRQV